MKTLLTLILICCVSFLYGQVYHGVALVEASSGLSDSQGDYPAKNLIDVTWRS